MSTRKVLLIIPELITGGAQRSLANLGLELSRHFQVWVVTFNRETPVAYPQGGELICLDVVPGKSLWSKFIAFRKRVTRLRRIKQKFQIDVAISFLEGADYVNVLSRIGEKVILSIRGSKLHDEIMRTSFFWLRSKWLIPRLYKKADALVAVNEGIAEELTHHYGLPREKVRVIGNFYDADIIRKLSLEPRPSVIENLYQHPVLVTSCRLNPEKGLAYLIRIFAELKNSLPTLKLVLVGDGPEKEQLVSLSHQLGLKITTQLQWIETPDVVITGYRENVFQFLNKATLYVANSSSEGFPNGIVEAMLCRVPVVSSNCPYGPAEILAPGIKTNPEAAYLSEYGMLLPVARDTKTVNVWIEQLLRLLKDESLRNQLSEKAFSRASEFKKETVLDQWLKLIHD